MWGSAELELNYDELRRIHRIEKNTSKLAEVDHDFFDAISRFALGEKQKYLASLKELSQNKTENFANTKKIIDEILQIRQKKILSKALTFSQLGETINESMALEEKILFSAIMQLLQKQKKLSESIIGGEYTAMEPQAQQEQEKTIDQVLLQVFEDVPNFVGTDLKEYGPFNKNQVISIPMQMAKLFVMKKIGRIVEQ